MKRCSAEWPLLDGEGNAVSWWRCSRKDKHTVHQSVGVVYTDFPRNEATIVLRWREAK